ncbi:MAG: HD domain-containing protein [Nitrospirae bacterium]|nr:HD domain-containing protein [Nitrospirota bacterium]
MNQNDLDLYKKWFLDYTSSFYPKVQDRSNLLLKVKHSHKVCENIVEISKGQQLSKDKIILAETTALFHDIGRFPQYAQYSTFNDSISVNHGKLGAEVLRKVNILQHIPDDEQELIMHSVKFHNAFSLPESISQEKKIFLQLIRDADKLDVWRVFAEYYEASEDERPSAAAHGLPDMPECSEKILSCIFDRKMASFRDIRTLNDFKLIQLSWVYDLNFNITYKLLLERDYINKYIEKLPHTDAIAQVSEYVHEFAYRRIRA